MKIMKLFLIILVSFGLGFAVSGGFSGKIPVKTENTGDHHEEAGGIKLNEKSQALIELKTAKARVGKLNKKIPVIGQIAQDAQTSVHVVSGVSGQIAQTRAQIGSPVNQGDVLCTVSKINGPAAIEEIKTPITGTVTGVFVKAGDRVDTVSSVYTVADLTRLQATFDVYEKNIADIRLAQKIMIYSVAYPGKVFEGEVTFISPRVDQDAYTIKVRALIHNPMNYLKLGMFVNADILTVVDTEHIIVPRQAVHTVNAKKVVFVRTGPDNFQAKEVKVQDESAEEIALASGVGAQEEIVVQNGFLLKSELLKSKMGEGCAD